MKKYYDVMMLGVYVLLLLLLNSIAASASFISLNTSLISKVEGQNLSVKVVVINKGDESAFNVQAELKMAGKTLLADKKAELPINDTYKAEKAIPISAAKPGTYPLVLIMHYTDANQYPFSALTCQTFVFNKEAVSPLFGQARSVAFSKEGKLFLTYKNLDDREVKARVRLTAPRELTVGEETREIAVAPKSEKETSFSIKNFSALSGSTYQVFAVAEFEDQNLHYTSITPGTIKITAHQEVFGINYTTVFIVLVILLVFFIGAQLFKKK